jgi:hypothetical protein
MSFGPQCIHYLRGNGFAYLYLAMFSHQHEQRITDMMNINLKNGLMINAILTGITGLGLVLFAELSAIYLIPGAPVWLIAALGIALVLFAIDVGIIARWKLASVPLVGFVFVADLLWVIGVPAILMLMPSAFTSLGVIASLAVTAAVACFALIEWQGLKAIYSTKPA